MTRSRRRSQPRHCVCMQGHLDGLPRATRARRGELVEPGATVSLHLSTCPHSDLARTTGQARPVAVAALTGLARRVRQSIERERRLAMQRR